MNRYDNCLICNAILDIKYFNGYGLVGSIEKKKNSYLVTVNDKSKIHRAKFDLSFKLIDNDGFPKAFYFCKYCKHCTNPDLMKPFFTLQNLTHNTMFNMYRITSNKIDVVEELIKITKNHISYGWHAKYNYGPKIWYVKTLLSDNKKNIDDILEVNLELKDLSYFNNQDDLINKLSIYQTFS